MKFNPYFAVLSAIRIGRQLTNDDASAPPASLPRELPPVAKIPAMTARCAPPPAPPPRSSISIANARVRANDVLEIGGWGSLRVEKRDECILAHA